MIQKIEKCKFDKQNLRKTCENRNIKENIICII